MSSASCEIRDNLYAFYDQAAQCEGIYADKQDCWSVIKNQPGTWPGIIYRVCRDLPEQESSVELFEKVQAGRYPQTLIATDENIHHLDPFLRARGFFPFMGWKGMARQYDANWQPPALPPTMEVVSLDNPKDREQWVRIVSTELISPTRFDPALTEILGTRPGIHFYLLKVDGVGVSTMLTCDSGHSTGLYMIATHHNFQRKGLGHILVQQIVGRITQQSKKPIILHATQKGEGLYVKSGFLPLSQFFLYRYLNPKP